MLPVEDYVQLQSNTANTDDAAGNNRAVQPLNDREVHVYVPGEQGVAAPTDEDNSGETGETGETGEVSPGNEDPEEEDDGAFALAASTVAATAVLLAF